MGMLRFIVRNYKKTILPFAALAAIIVFSLYGVQGAAKSSSSQQYDLTLRMLKRAADDCYAIEGQYPPNINYLCKHYRVSFDEKKYIVVYEIFAPDIRPAIKLISRGSTIYE